MMTSTGYWSTWCPGKVMCCICFECKDKAELAVDTDGVTWDVCKGMCAIAAGITEALDNRPPVV